MGQADTDNNSERAIAVRSLYITTFGNLLNTTLDGHASLYQTTAYRLVEGLERHLERYDGPDNDPYAFLLWASAILTRGSAIVVLIENHRRVINGAYKAVREHKSFRHLLTGSAEEREEFDWLMLKWVDEHFDSLLEPGTAKLSTRFYGAARFAALTLKNREITRRKYHADVSFEEVEQAIAERERIGGHRSPPLRDIPEHSHVMGSMVRPDPLEKAYREAGL